MNRRTFLGTIPGAVCFVGAGCLQNEAGAGDTPTIVEHSFEMTAASETPESPAVTELVTSTARGEVTIAGTATVRNGCTNVLLGSGPRVVDGGRIVEMSLETREEGEMCTQSMKDIGYRMVISYADACPKTVRISQIGRDTKELSLNCL